MKPFLSNWDEPPKLDFIDFLLSGYILICFILAGKNI
jgi:hypothetical protein